MATNLGIEDLLPASVTPMRILAGLYRSTFVDKLQERFRLMLAGAYSVYVTALGEGFDPALRAHLTDILQDIIARTPELTEVFEEELMGYFRAAMEQAENPDASKNLTEGIGALQPMELSPRQGVDPLVQEFIAKTVRSVETRHGSIILALTRTYVRLVDQSVEDFRPPWTPASLFSAFATVLQRIDVPIHEKVKLALYKMFAQEVLRHMGDACLAFRDVLPTDLAQLNMPGRGSPDSPESGASPEGFPQSHAFSAKDGAENISCAQQVLAGMGNPDGMDGGCHAGGKVDERPADGERKGSGSLKLFRASLILLGSLSVIGAGWWVGTYFARTKSGSPLNWNDSAGTNGALGESLPAKIFSEPSPQAGSLISEDLLTAQPAPEASISSPIVPVPPAATQATADQSATPPVSSESQPMNGLDPHQKRELLKTVRLRNFSWRVDSGRNEMLFDLIIANTGKARIAGIEVVCSQYSEALDFLEAAKTILGEPVEPGQSKTFKAVPIGFSSKQTERVNCVIADAAPVQ